MKLRVASGVVFNQVGEELVLLDLGRGVYYGLDPVGTRMWQAIVDGATESEVAAAVAAEYDVDLETTREDVRRLLRELRETGLVEEVEE